MRVSARKGAVVDTAIADPATAIGRPAASAALPATGIALLVLLTIGWGTNWPAMKLVLSDMTVWLFRSLCLTLGGGGLLLIAAITRQPLLPRRADLPGMALVALLSVTGWHLFSGFGLQHIEAGRAAIVAFTMPVWASLLAVPVLGERLDRRRVISLAFGLAGLMVLIGPALGSLAGAPLGVAYMLGAALSWAAGTVSMKRFRFGLPVVSLTAWLLLLGGLPVVIALLVVDGLPNRSDFDLKPDVLAAFAYVIFGAMILCHWAWFKIVTIFPASIAAIGTLAIPVVGVISSALWLGEPLGAREIAALAMVLTALGVVLLVRPVGRR